MGAAERKPEPGVAGASAPAIAPVSAPVSAPVLDNPPLVEVLRSEPFRFEFFAALRVLARIAEREPATAGEARSSLDRIRFRSHQSLSFPPSEIWDIDLPAGDGRSDGRLAEMTVAFLGMTGSLGALPRPYTELVMQRIRKGDRALRDFLDLFNERLIQLFARGGEKYRFYLTHELAEARGRWRRAEGRQKLRAFLIEERPRIDLFSQVLLDLGGVGTPLVRYKDSVRDEPAPRLDIADATLRYFSGHLAQTHRSAVALGRMLEEYFGVSANIVSFVGQWVPLPSEYQTCLRRRDLAELADDRPRPGSCADPRLGQNTVVGSRIWEVQGRFRVRLGPLTFDQFQRFLPIGDRFRQAAHLVRLFAGATFDFDLQPVLAGPEVPWCRFEGKGPRGPRLGWNTWLRNRPFTRPVDDAVFRVADRVSLGQ